MATKKDCLVGRLAVDGRGRVGIVTHRTWTGWKGTCLFSSTRWSCFFPRFLDPAEAESCFRLLGLQFAVRELHDATWWTPLSIGIDQAGRLWRIVRRLAKIPPDGVVAE